jgi:hypothetical protein
MQEVAERKRKENIGEYIIYMYQMEDLIRAYDFNMDALQQYMVSHYPIEDKGKAEVGRWFKNLAEEMEKEGIRKSGHLPAIQRIVNELAKLHWRLLKEDKAYFQIYQEAKPFVVDHVLAAGGKEVGHEIQVCLNGVYGLLLCRLHGQKVEDDLLSAAEKFGKLLAYLSHCYLRES